MYYLSFFGQHRFVAIWLNGGSDKQIQTPIMSGDPGARLGTDLSVFANAHRRNLKVPAPPECTVPGAIALFKMPQATQPWAPLMLVPPNGFHLPVMLP
jgi:hypothetical protein